MIDAGFPTAPAVWRCGKLAAHPVCRNLARHLAHRVWQNPAVVLRIPIAAAAALCLAACAVAAGPAWQRLGAFSNVRFTADHAYGYSIQLWQQDDALVGHLLHANGPDGDTPLGVLEDVTYDGKTGALRFTARLTTGVIVEHGTSVPNCLRYVFAGRLQSRILTGTMRVEELTPGAARSAARTAPESLSLRWSPQQTGLMPDPPDRAGWDEETEILLKVRGPRCER